MKRTYILIAAILILSLLTMGCGLISSLTKKGKEVAMTRVVGEVESIEKEKTAEKEEPPTPTAVSEATPEEAQEEAATATPQPTATQAAQPEEGPATELDAEAYARLHGLDSYRYTLALNAVEGGKTTALSGKGAFVKDPPAAEFSFEMTGEEGTDLVQFIRIGDKVYLYDQDQGGWIVFASDSPMAGGMDMLGMIMDEMNPPYEDKAFKRVDAHERVNGVDCSHYRADPRDLPEGFVGPNVGQIDEGSVDVWVANGAGHLMRMEMAVKGQDKEGNPLEARFKLEISDVNEPIQISPPPEDQIVDDWTSEEEEEETTPGESGGASSQGTIARALPRPDDAGELEGMDLTTAQALAAGSDFDLYRTGLAVQEAADFFKEAWSGEGWQVQEGEVLTDNMAFLFFAREGTTINLTLYQMEGQDGCLVIVSVQE